jgi:hypothetical protein
LLGKLYLRFSWPKAIHVILDNYCIHDSGMAAWALLEAKGRIKLHYLPPYCPKHNKIERLWQDLHANVTRNHTCGSWPLVCRRCWARWGFARRRLAGRPFSGPDPGDRRADRPPQRQPRGVVERPLRHLLSQRGNWLSPIVISLILDEPVAGRTILRLDVTGLDRSPLDIQEEITVRAGLRTVPR